MVDASQLLFRVNIPIRNIFHQKWNVNCICLVVVYHVDLSTHRDIYNTDIIFKFTSIKPLEAETQPLLLNTNLIRLYTVYFSCS